MGAEIDRRAGHALVVGDRAAGEQTAYLCVKSQEGLNLDLQLAELEFFKHHLSSFEPVFLWVHDGFREQNGLTLCCGLDLIIFFLLCAVRIKFSRCLCVFMCFSLPFILFGETQSTCRTLPRALISQMQVNRCPSHRDAHVELPF